ncbi:mucin-like protein 3 [Psammomys obesus]|uniref:mucin-like protein 3 n=1 Tax=Psammomys obesus TaxID=48139 RepID=UPI00245340BB|nr:mucin-like protein 3 [Psammomys obesus]
MAQLTSGLCPTFGFLCCLLFLPASWEAGAKAFPELQKTGEPPAAEPSPPPPPGLPHRAPSEHADPNSGRRLPDLPKPAATQKPRKPCNVSRLAKPVHRPVDDSKATDSPGATDDHEKPPALEKKVSSPKEDPMVRNGRSADDPKSTLTEKGSGGKRPTSAPRRTTVCKSTTSKSRVTRNSGTPVGPVEASSPVSTASHKPTTRPHDSELRKSPPSSVKSTEATPGTPGADDHRAPSASDKPVHTTTEHAKRSTSASKTTNPPVTSAEHKVDNTSTKEEATRSLTPTKYERETVTATQALVTLTDRERQSEAANGTARAPTTPAQHKGETTSATEGTTHAQVMPIEHSTTPASENTTHASAEPTDHSEEASPTTQKAPKVSESPTGSLEKTTPAAKTVKATGSPAQATAGKATADKATAPPPHFETTHPGVLGIVTTRTDVGFPTPSGPPRPRQSTHSSPAGPHAAGARRGADSFPAWAIVIVILLAVIVLLVSLGLIFLVSCASRARHVLSRNSEDSDPEDIGGHNSYPVYLMEQQNLKPNQIPTPPCP